jgi:RNase H-fold protein (predicted Holliday junction resolvase)
MPNIKEQFEDQTVDSVTVPFLLALVGEDELGAVVRAHIHIEHELEQFIATVLPRADELGRMDYSAKVRLALACGLPRELKPTLNAIGTLRNKFAHRLGTRLTRKEADDFFNLFGKTQKHTLALTEEQIMTVAANSQHKALQDMKKPLTEQSPKDRMVAYLVTLFYAVISERVKLTLPLDVK